MTEPVRLYIPSTTGYIQYTFEDQEIDDFIPDVSTELEQNVMPASGPMNNQGFDFNGVQKIITISGHLLDSTSSVTKYGNDPNPTSCATETTYTITTKEDKKKFLEYLQNGRQTLIYLRSNNDINSALASQIPVATSANLSNLLRATEQPTSGYILRFNSPEKAGESNRIFFEMTIWVAGF